MRMSLGLKILFSSSREPYTHIGRHLLRWNRFLLAAFCSLAVCGTMFFMVVNGVMEMHVAFNATMAIISQIFAFYLMFHFGWNRFARDPSLTMPMCVTALMTLFYVMYNAAAARETFPIFIALILIFAVFRFPTRILLLQSSLVVLAYGAMLWLLHLRWPGSVGNDDVVRCMVMATAMPLLAWVGGQVMAARRSAMQKLSASEARFRRLTDLSSDWYWEQDHGCRFTMVSIGLQTSAGISPGRLIGKTFADMSGGHLPESLSLAMRERESFANLEYQVFDDHGAPRWLSLSGAPLLDKHGRFAGYFGTGRDVTEHKRIEQQIHFQAHHDALTTLPNRIMLKDRLNQAISSAQREGRQMWVIFLDLDRFKLINDSLGHKVGDILLQTISTRLQSLVRNSDTVARLGGDEFVIILPDADDGRQSLHLIERLRECVAMPIKAGEHELAIGCSLGIAVYPTDGSHAEELIEHADIAMYRAKEAGRGNFQFYKASMNQKAVDRLNMENALRAAVLNNEFVLHYQPQIDLSNGKMVGVEALIRWHHPRLGLIPPEAFIHVAEEMGIIVQIGEWALRTACLQNKAWRDAGHPCVRVAVNLSARQLGQKNLVEVIGDIIAQSGADASLLELEITESLAMTDVEHTIGILRGLKALGVQLSIDDFGTGYSSLSYLKQLPIDALKIDRAFVRDITCDPDDALIVSAIIGLAHSLQLKVIAEGVEDVAQLAYLNRYQCDEMQGYLVSKPVSAADLEQLLQRNFSFEGIGASMVLLRKT